MLGRLDVSRGTRVDVCSYVVQRLPWLWPDPERVDPDRFLAAPAPDTWFPFLAGPHTCLGVRLAMIELPLMAARILDAFEVTPPTGFRAPTSASRCTPPG